MHFIALLLVLLTGCFSQSAKQLPVLRDDLSLQANNPDETKLVIFNDSHFGLIGTDGRETFSIKLNGKNIPPLGRGQYAQVILPRGLCRVDLVQWRDLKRFSSTHTFEFNRRESFLRIYATDDSNEAHIVASLPPGFAMQFQSVK